MSTRLVRATLATALCLLLVATGWSVPANAAPVAPMDLTVSGAEAGESPVLSWSRVTGASSYDIQVSATVDFQTTLASLQTTNVQYVPAVGLPDTVHWRVRAKDAQGGASDWTAASFARTVDGPPSLVSPADQAEIQPPEDSPVLTWTAVAGASGYLVQVGSDPDFADQNRYAETSVQSTSYLFTPTLVAPHYWRVAAVMGPGVQTSWSPTREFDALGLRAVNAGTASPDHQSPLEYVEDAVLDWDPVPGAVTYQLQVDTDNDFDTLLINQSGITGTRYARPNTFNNDDYYWRVRGVDTMGVPSPWEAMPVFTFRRAWPRQPQLEYPADGATVGDPFHFEWKPIRLASRYKVELSQDQTFTTGVTRCETVHTSYTPTTKSDCWPAAGGIWWWRVQGFDGDGPVTDLISAEKRSFVYQAWTVDAQSLTPASGHQGPPPTLSWAPVRDAAKYKVYLTRMSTGSVTTATTAATSYSPRSNLKPKPGDDETYRWDVVPITHSGREGNSVLAGSQPTFTVTSSGYGQAASPEPISPVGGTFLRFPTLTWTPMNGVDTAFSTTPPTYQVYLRQVGAQSWTALPGTTQQASYEDFTATHLNPGTTYQWMVSSTGAGGTPAATSSGVGSFTIGALDDVTNQRVSIRAEATAGQSCTATLPVRCAQLPETPVLRWDSVPGAGSYLVSISRDQEHTNPYVPSFQVDGTEFRPNVSYEDSQAGTAYYWYVQPCTADGHCNARRHASHAFEKRSDAVVTQSTADENPDKPGVQVRDDVTFTWNDYIDSHMVAASVNSAARIEADKYRIQVASDLLFQTVVETKTVDQPQYTSFETTYPEGPLWWRVQAIDRSGNELPWSAARAIEKQSPVPTLGSPADNEPRASGAAFRWQPLGFAASYDVEVYRNGDTSGSTSNRVVIQNTKLPALALAKPLPRTDGPYVWRVRRADAKNRKGAWSDYRSFQVAGGSPAYSSPAHGVVVAPNEALFRWTAPSTADAQPATYRFQRRKAGTTSLTENVLTVARAWAPLTTLAEGSWEWRVVALDVDGKELGDTGEAWRGFTVASGPVATQQPVISGAVTVWSELTVQPPTWNLPDVANTWQWLRDSQVIDGATGQSYVIQQADAGKKLSVRVTGTKPGYAPTTITTSAGTVGAGQLLESVTAPTITGTAAVGESLTAEPGTWSQTSGVLFDYQWLRNGVAIPGATNRTYRPVLADVVQRLVVRVTAKKSNYLNGVATSGQVTVAKVKTTVTAYLSPSTVKVGARSKVAVTLRATGTSNPSGAIRVLKGTKVLKKATIKSGASGRVTVTLPKLPRGKHKLVVVFIGSSTLSPSKSAKIVLKVVR